MDNARPTPLTPLEEFDLSHSREGLLIRYARGRMGSLWARMVMSFAVIFAAAILETVGFAVFLLALLILSESVDVFVLRRIIAHEGDHDQVAQMYLPSVLSAAFQSAVTAFAVVLLLVAAHDDGGTLFALAILGGAATNAGVVIPYNPPASYVRLAVFGLVGLGYPILDSFVFEHLDVHAGYELLGSLIMAYWIGSYVLHVVGARRAAFARNRALLVAQHQTVAANARLEAKQVELRQLSAVAQHARDSVIIAGPDQRIVWVNDAFSRITGYSRDEAIGTTPAKLLNGPETDMAASDDIGDAINKGVPFRTEILNYTKDGRQVWMDSQIVPLLSSSGEVEMVVAIERDVTEARDKAGQLAEAKIAAEKGERAKSEFLATMSHEIRTPMNGIIGMADLLAEQPLSGDARLYVDTIQHSAEALLKIINDILDFSKLDAGHLTIVPEDFSLRDCVMGAMALLRPQAQEKGLTYDIRIESKLPARMRGDAGRIRQVLVNLIGNALKFTEQGGVYMTLSCAQASDGFDVVFSVRDTGIGIPEDRIEHVFSQFSQEETARTRRYGGTGLGLTISRLLVRRMGGDLTVISEPGQGSTFTAKIRLEHAADDTDPIVSAKDTEQRVALPSGLSILVAEDNRTNRLLLEKMLIDCDLMLHFAVNGREAVDQQSRMHPDVILMDMSMPEMDGIEATRQIRALSGPQPRIIALTANAFASDRAACLAAGMDDFLSKPVRRSELLAKLTNLTPSNPL